MGGLQKLRVLQYAISHTRSCCFMPQIETVNR